MSIGIVAAIMGPIVIIGGVLLASLATMIVGQAIAGVGFGASFTAALRLIVPLVATNQRAGVVAGIYIVSYLAFGVPIVVAGQLTGALGPVPTVIWYSAVTIVLALISLAAHVRIERDDRRRRVDIVNAPPLLADT